MINKILFFVDNPFNQRDFKRFGIKLLQKNGFEVEVWDLSNVLNPVLVKNYTPPDKIHCPHCKIFNDKDHVLNKIKNLSHDTFVIIWFSYSLKSYCVYKAISASQAAYASFMANALPSVWHDKRGRGFYYLKKLFEVSWKKRINWAFQQLPFAWMGIKPASLILAGGEQCLKYPDPVDKTTEVVWGHTLDYDIYLKEKNIPSKDCNIAVFLDQNIPFHPDSIQFGYQPSINADKYYPLLNKFFSLIEQKLGLEVIIAAHPRSHYEKLPDYFDGRKCIRGKTIKLVKESQLVLAHMSTSLNFANLFYKPVIFLTSHDLDKSKEGPFIRIMANWFGKNPVFVDSDININWERELMVSKRHYNCYRRAYIKTKGSKDLPFWKIVANRLKNWA